MSDTQSDPYEPYLHRNLLRTCRDMALRPDRSEHIAEAETLARRVFDVLLNTPVVALRKIAGEVLRGLLSSNHPSLRTLDTTVAGWVAKAIVMEHGVWGIRELVASVPIRKVLLSLLGHPSARVRRAAVRALEPATNVPVVRQALMKLLNDPSWYVRW